MTASALRLGAVGYLNARPLVYGLEGHPRFDLRYDIPSECATLLHRHAIDVGLIPSIEYLRGPQPYDFVPGPAVTSRGPVASVAIYTTKPMTDVGSIALDTSSRTSVALVRVLCARLFKIQPVLESRGPDLADMLAHSDAALIIGDNALLLDDEQLSVVSAQLSPSHQPPATGHQIEKIDLGSAWTDMTGLPFVYAIWAGWPGAMSPDDVAVLQRARDEGVADADGVARAYYPDDARRQAVAREYLRDNIRYYLGSEEIEGLTTFFRYATELGLAAYDGPLRFYHAEHHGAG